MARKYRCPVCKEDSCGRDNHTKTKYTGPEVAIGDRLKVILREVYDMVDYDNLQAYEIKALLIGLVDEHVEETDDLGGEE